MASIPGKIVHIDASFGRMAVHLYGESHRRRANPILLVHGFPLDHSMWKGQIASLSTDRLVIVPDLPGCGGSDSISGCATMAAIAHDLAEVAAQLAPGDPMVYCGLSMGGYIGWEMHKLHGELLSHLIMCDTRAASDSETIAKGRTMMAAKLDAAETDSAMELETLANSMVGKLFAKTTSEHGAAIVEATRQVIQSSRPAAIAAYLRGMAIRTDFSHQMTEIDLPTLFVCGEDDSITPPDEMRELAGQIQHSTFVEIKAAGHLAPLEQPEQTNEAIRALLAS